MKYIYCCLLVYAFVSSAAASTTIPEFHKVSAHIFRGGRPDEAGLRYLAKIGIKTVINLENKQRTVESEAIAAAQLGIREISMPMSGFFRPDRTEVETVLRLINDPANQPVFVHCEHGQDRTGVVIGLYRVGYQGWSSRDAYAEMLKDGFHPILFLLKGFYDDVTGYVN